ncbi:MAG: hypothetical protein ACYDAK_14010 [Candidatus Limnocylindrales bacterium]
MAKASEPSYTDLVYEVLSSAEHPLTFQEIFDAVSERRSITTKNPKGTIRSALSQGVQLVNVGDGRYGYLPRLVQGSLLRVPLTEKKPANHPLVFPDEVRQALWPSFFESQKRSTRNPVQARLPNGGEVSLSLDFLGTGTWGSQMPESLRQLLITSYAAVGDSLLIKVTDAMTGHCDVTYEPRRKRDEAAIAQRNRELADVAYQILREGRNYELPIWNLVIPLLARGAYRADVAPDSLETVLKADPRFVDAGLNMWMLAEDMTPAMEAVIPGRKRMEAEIFHPAEGTPSILERESMPSPVSLRSAMERTMADIGAVLSEHDFGSIEEANAFLQEMLAKGGIPRQVAETPLEKAQDVMYQAWESPMRRDKVRLAKKALDLSPDCADAYVLLAEETAHGPKEAADLYAKGVAAGERALGKETFEEDVGHFWGAIETRPYMRARFGLAEALWAMGKQHEAIEHAWDLLRLNPGDNQGVRYVLLTWLLESDDEVGVRKLLDLYPEDAAALWLYARALYAFRTEHDTARSRSLLAEAIEGNPYVPDYLLGKKRLPAYGPEMVSLGGESEAVYCAIEQMTAWRETPGALAWLAERSQTGRGRRAR